MMEAQPPSLFRALVPARPVKAKPAKAAAKPRTKAQEAERQMMFGLGALLIMGLGALAIAGGANVRIPEISVAESARSGASWVAGIGIIIASAVLIYQSVARVSPALAAIGIIFSLTGLTIVGVSVGVPPILEPLIGLLNALIEVLNYLLKIADKLV